MSIQNLLVALQVIVPSALFGAVILAAASSGLARLLGLRRRPFRLGTRSRSVPSHPRRAPGLQPVPVAATTPAALHARPSRPQDPRG